MFFQLFKTNQDDMLEDLEQGDVAETVRVFFEQSNAVSVNICFISKTSFFFNFAHSYRLIVHVVNQSAIQQFCIV